MIGYCLLIRQLQVCIAIHLVRLFSFTFPLQLIFLIGLKAVLLHKKKKLPSVPIAYSEQMKETHANIENLLRKIKYEYYKWEICADLKMIAILCGLKKGFSKYPCHICLFDSRAETEQHYDTFDWPERTAYVVKEFGIEAKPLVPANRIILPPLHVKLGLIRTFIVTALKQRPQLLQELKAIFKRSKSDQKLLNGMQYFGNIRELMNQNYNVFFNF